MFIFPSSDEMTLFKNHPRKIVLEVKRSLAYFSLFFQQADFLCKKEVYMTISDAELS